MADLQDELHTTPEAGGLDDRSAEPFAADPFTEPYVPDAVPDAGPAADPLVRAHTFLARHPVADGYSGLPWALRHLPRYDLELGESAVDTDVPRMREGHVGALFWSLHLPEGPAGDRAVGATLEQLDLVRTVVRAHPESLCMAYTASDVNDARHRGRVAVVAGPAGAGALGDSLGILRALHSLGLRVLTLSGASWASGAGLTRFGEEVVREMNRVGVLADLSGTSDATIARAMAASKAPVVFTRSAARALRPHPANLPDDVLAELGAAKGSASSRSPPSRRARPSGTSPTTSTTSARSRARSASASRERTTPEPPTPRTSPTPPATRTSSRNSSPAAGPRPTSPCSPGATSNAPCAARTSRPARPSSAASRPRPRSRNWTAEHRRGSRDKGSRADAPRAHSEVVQNATDADPAD